MNQLDLFNKASEYQSVRDGEYIHVSQFIAPSQSDLFFDQLNNINWQQEGMKIYGKILPFPRLTVWYGDPQKTYYF